MVPLNCLTHYLSGMAMHGDGRLREKAGADRQEMKDNLVLRITRRMATMLIMPLLNDTLH